MSFLLLLRLHQTLLGGQQLFVQNIGLVFYLSARTHTSCSKQRSHKRQTTQTPASLQDRLLRSSIWASILVVFTPRSSSELYLEYFLCYVGPEPRSFYWKFTRLTWIQKPGVGRLRPVLTESSVCVLTCAHLCKDAHG